MNEFPPSLCALLDTLTDACKRILGDGLVGVYLHGSLAAGCFHPARSDIDFLVVTGRAPALPQKAAWLAAVDALVPAAPAKGLEGSVVLARFCRDFVYPTPYELHYSPMHRARYLADPVRYASEMHGTDPDLAAHFTIARRHGIALYGPPPEQLFAPVPAQAYGDSLWRDAADAPDQVLQNPGSTVLNLCRTLAFFQDGLALSKEEGGRWALEHLGPDCQPLIAASLVWYRSETAPPPDAADARRFALTAVAEIQRAHSGC